MANRQAKIELVGDVQGFKESIDKAKGLLKSLGEVKIDDKASKQLKETLENDLAKAARDVQMELHGIKAVLAKAGEEGGKAFDSKKLSGYIQKAGELKRKLDGIKDVQKEIGADKVSGGAAGESAGGGGGALMKGGRAGLRGITRAASAVGLTMGVAGAMSRATGVARERVGIRGLTGGELGDEGAGVKLGFTTNEFRSRESDVARATGKSMSGEELTKAVTQTMKIERAYGVGSETQTNLMTAGRKSGVKDQTKFLGDTVGTAVAAGLDGSRISEFMSASANYLSEMSQGINIDANSLRGFAGALSSIPFFAQDPNRAFNMIRSLNQTFQSGDPYQRTLATRAILNETPGADLGAVEMRRKMGLFGEVDEGTRGLLAGGTKEDKALLKTLDVSPGEIVANIFKDVMNQTEGLSKGNRMFAFQQATGLDAGAAMTMFTKLDKGKGLSAEEIDKFKNAKLSPEERIAKSMAGREGELLKFSGKMSEVLDIMAGKIAGPIAELGNKIELNSNQLANVATGLTGLTLMMGLLAGTNVASMFGGLGKGLKIPKGMKGLKMPKMPKMPKFGKAGGTALRTSAEIAASKGGGAFGKVAGGLGKGVLKGAGKVASKVAWPLMILDAIWPDAVGEGSDDPQGMMSKMGEEGTFTDKLKKKQRESQKNNLLDFPKDKATERAMSSKEPTDSVKRMSEEKSVSVEPTVAESGVATDENTVALRELTRMLSFMGSSGFSDRTKSPMAVGSKVGKE